VLCICRLWVVVLDVSDMFVVAGLYITTCLANILTYDARSTTHQTMVYLQPTPFAVGMILFRLLHSSYLLPVVLPWRLHGAFVLSVTEFVPQINIGVEL